MLRVSTRNCNHISGNIPHAEFYALQSALSIQLVMCTFLGIALGGFAAICIVALGMMQFIVWHPVLSQALRLNTD
jgi:hypothetical protein